MEGEELMKNKTLKKKGFALPLVLVVLLVGALLVSLTFEIVGNLFSSSRYVVEDVEMYNAASDGVEQGKAWILNAREEDGRLPRWEATDPGGELVSGDLTGTGEDVYDVLLVRKLNSSTLPGWNYPDGSQVAHGIYSQGHVQVRVRIFDMGYTVGSGVDEEYVPGFPPRLVYDAGEVEGMSARMGPTYATSNRGEGTTGSGFESVELGYYLIRSTATFEDNEKTVEEAVILRL